MFWAEGLISAVVVLIGVIAASRLERRREIQRQAEADVLELGSLITYVSAGYVATDGSMNTSMDSEWWHRRDRAWELVNRLQINVKRLPLRRRKRASEQLERYVLKFAAADSMFVIEAERPPKFVALELSTNELRDAIFGRSAELSEERYRKMQALQKLWRRGVSEEGE